MSLMTNYGENKLIDFFRSQSWSLPGSLYLGLLSAHSDSAVTELSGTGYARQEVVRALATWAGTQGVGTVLASSGTTHQTSNNALVDFGTSGSAWGTGVALGLFDAVTGGNCIWVCPFDTSLVIGSGDPVSFPAGRVRWTLGLSGGLSDYLCNKLIDFILRGQSYTFPATVYLGLCLTAPNNAGAGTEPAVGAYARVSWASSLAAMAGTQSAGSTAVSSGTGGQTSNNAALVFPVPTADWGSVVGDKVMDAASAGNMLFYSTFPAKTVNLGATAPTYPAGARRITVA